jgi:CubicO group peptidase (beta-lactamase class C family)
MKHLNVELLKANIEKSAYENITSGRVSGLSALVYQDGRVLYRNNFGVMRIGESTPVDDRTIYRMMSMTKPITAVAILILIERGLLSLDTRIDKYIPEFAEQYIGGFDENSNIVRTGKASTPITIHHLLTHTSGIGSRPLWAKQLPTITDEDKSSLENIVRAYSRLELAFEPATATSYSATAAFGILGRIVELITGEHFDVFLKKNIFYPCEMYDTTFEPTEEQFGRMITEHNFIDENPVAVESVKGCVTRDVPPTTNLGGSGLISTLDDYANFAKMLLDGGVFNGRRILSEESVRLMATPQVSEEIQPGPARWGLSVRIIVGENRRPVGTYGWSGAYGTHFWVDPENKIFAVYLKNSHFDGGSGAKTSAQFERDVYASFEE